MENEKHPKHQGNNMYTINLYPYKIGTPLIADKPPHDLEMKSKFDQKSNRKDPRKFFVYCSEEDGLIQISYQKHG